MLRYLLTWTPFAAIIAAIGILATPFLGWLVLMVVLLAALAALVALAGAIIASPYLLGRSVRRRWRERSGANQHGVVLSPAQRHNPQLVIRDAKGSIRWSLPRRREASDRGATLRDASRALSVPDQERPRRQAQVVPRQRFRDGRRQPGFPSELEAYRDVEHVRGELAIPSSVRGPSPESDGGADAGRLDMGQLALPVEEERVDLLRQVGDLLGQLLVLLR